MANSVVQTIREAEIDARSLSEFISKDASFTVTRRLAPTIHTLDYYLLVLNNVKDKGDLADIAISDTLDKLEQLEPMVIQRVEDAINNTAVEGGVLADTFVVVDGSLSQRTINKGLESIADLSTINNPKDGLRVYVKSYHAGIGIGGGYFTYDSSKASINDGGVNINGWVRGQQSSIRVTYFGAVGDGIADDTQAIQNAINFAVENGTDLHFPACANYYKITDTLVITNGGKSQYVYPAINITGRYYSSRIRVESDGIIEAVISIEGAGTGYWFDSIFIDANDKARHGIKNAEDIYNTQIYMDKVRIFSPIDVGISLRTYFCDLRNCFVENSKVGFKIGGVISAPATTVNMSGCYAVRCLDVGYDFGYLTYCTFNSLACDDSKLAYRIASAYGVTMNSCGAERVSKFLHVLAFRGLVINAPYVLRLGAQKEGEEPELYGIELGTGYGCTISGVNFVPAAIAPVKYILGLTSDSYGSNDVNILDSSINSAQVYSVDTYRFGSNSVRGEFYNTIFRSPPNKIPVGDPFKLAISDKKIETTYLIELDPGDYLEGDGNSSLDEKVKRLKNLTGSGRIIIRGTGTSPSETVIRLTYGGLSLNSCRIPVIFENVTLRNSYNNTSYNTLMFITSSKVIFKNCIIASNGRTISSFISATHDSEVLLQNTVFSLGGANVASGIFNDTSPQNVSWWGDTLPTVGFVNKGVRFNLNAPEAGQATQYVCVSDAIAETEWVAVNSLVQPETPPAE